jgi:hypothetical protein
MDYDTSTGRARATRPMFKHQTVTPRAVDEARKDRAEARAWAQCCAGVDARDKGICFVTGRYLKAGALDRWDALERAHLEFRSKSKARRYLVENVVTVSRGVHQLIDGHALLLLDTRGRPARRVQDIDHVAWNRNLVAKSDEPCRIRKGLPVKKD